MFSIKVIQLLQLFQIVTSHGFLFSPNIKNIGSIRGIENIAYNIDLLRNPTSIDCSTLSKGKQTSIELNENEYHSVYIAASIGAQHKGLCRMEVIDPNTGEIIEIANENNCVSKGHIFKSINDPKCIIPDKLVTNDMCLLKWSFIPKNIKDIKCKTCILKWIWNGEHVIPHEHFENCADIIITTNFQDKVNNNVNVQDKVNDKQLQNNNNVQRHTYPKNLKKKKCIK